MTQPITTTILRQTVMLSDLQNWPIPFDECLTGPGHSRFIPELIVDEIRVFPDHTDQNLYDNPRHHSPSESTGWWMGGGGNVPGVEFHFIIDNAAT